MPKFKAGDKVGIVKNTYNGFEVGQTGVIDEIRETGYYVKGKFFMVHARYEKELILFHPESDLELIEENEKE